MVLVASMLAASYASIDECQGAQSDPLSDAPEATAAGALMQRTSQTETVDYSNTEVVGLLHETSNCAARTTGFVGQWGEVWTDFMELLVPSNTVMAQLINALTPLLTEGKMEALASMGIAQRTKPPCDQHGAATMLLETALALEKSVSEQVSELHDNLDSIHTTLVKLAGTSSLMESVMCPAFTNFINHFHETVQLFVDHLREGRDLYRHEQLVQQSKPDLLQAKGADAQRTELMVVLQRTNDACEGGSKAFVEYADAMVKYCQAMRDCSTTLAMWSGLDQATDKCIATFRKYRTGDTDLLCK